MRNMDRLTIEKFGISADLLMENAGNAAYSVLSREFGIQGKRFIIFCGVGNNGGDGLVLARKIYSSGGEVRVFILGNPSKFKGAAKSNFDIVSRLPIETRNSDSFASLQEHLEPHDAIIDAIFGTGLSRNVEGMHRDAIQWINKSEKPVYSIDVPSGVNGDTGKTMGVAVRANATVTFGLPKTGNMLYPGYDLCGKLYVSHISFPPSIRNDDSLKVEINQPLEITPRDKDGHKGDFGQALFIAGASSYFGAPYFAAFSFLKSGGGYSRLAAPKSMTPFIAGKASEIVMIPQKETKQGSISLENKQALLELSKRMDMVVLGPGLSLEKETQQLTRELAREINKPLLIDGDGITALCQNLNILKERTAETILTPHLGEMSRLTGISISDIDVHKIDILQRTANELHAIIVLKGAHSLIGYPDQRVWINMSGNSGMATAGSGDVLTGTIAAMFGLGLKLQDAVRQGVFIHGFSGDLAAEDIGEDGITAQDILDYLPLAMKLNRTSMDEILRDRYAGVCVI